jgi:hypothetical protein
MTFFKRRSLFFSTKSPETVTNKDCSDGGCGGSSEGGGAGGVNCDDLANCETIQTLAAELITVQNAIGNEIEILYSQQVNAAAGAVTIPAGATILENQFAGGRDAFVSTSSSGQPTGNFPVTGAGTAIDVTSFDALGNFVLSGVPSVYPVIIVFPLAISFADFGNLNPDQIVEYWDGDEHIPLSYVDTDGTLAANSDTKIATQKAVRTYILQKIADLVDSSPATLDTLNELANALGDDANFATTITTLINAKVATSDKVDTPTAEAAVDDTKWVTIAKVQAWWTYLKANTAQTFSQIITFLKRVEFPIQVSTSVSGTHNIDCTYTWHDITLVGNTTLDLTNLTASASTGTVHRVVVRQDATGSRTLALTAGKFSGTLYYNTGVSQKTVIYMTYNTQDNRMQVDCNTDTLNN